MIEHLTPAVRSAGLSRRIALAGTLAAVASATAAAAPQMLAPTPPAKDAGATPAPAMTPAPTDSRAARRAAEAALAARYLVPPMVADEFGYRIVWQTEPQVTLDATAQAMNVTADSAWLGDSAGSVVRVRRDSGETVWRASTIQGVERMISIEHLPAAGQDNAYVITELGTTTLDAVTGEIMRRSRFSHLPATEPTVFGPSMIFGTKTGLACWYQYVTGYNWRATTVGGQVLGKVAISGETAIAAGTDGNVLAINAPNAAILWTRKLSAGVEAATAVDDVACYVAGLDQSLWAFDLMRGRVLWQYFTSTPLTNAPVRMGDGLYLQIPGEGLVAFTPLPQDKPDGEVQWKSTAAGNVIGQVGTELMSWCRASRTLSAVDAGTGRVIRTASLPKVEVIRFDRTAKNGVELLVSSTDGRIQRLEPLAASGSRAADRAARAAATADDGAEPADARAGE